MDRDTLDVLIEKMFEFHPIMSRRLFKFDSQSDEMMLPINQMMVLAVLHEEKSLPISEIGRRLYISKPQMTKTIDRLISEDFVERVHDKVDRRIINVILTERGIKYVSGLFKIAKDNMRYKLSSLSEEAILQLTNSIETAANILKGLE